MIGLENLQLLLGIQGIVQTLVIVALWMIVSMRLRLGPVGILFAVLPLVGVLIVPVVIAVGTLFLGATTDPTLLYTAVPNFVSFLFMVAPLIYVVAKLKPAVADNVFK